jgi:hypothetical protein
VPEQIKTRRVLSPIPLGASAFAFAISSVIGSLSGTGGTLIGGMAGAVITTGAGAVYEHIAGQAATRVRQHHTRTSVTPAAAATPPPPMPHGWLRDLITHIPRKTAITALTSAALVTGGGYAAIAATEAGILHKPLSAAIAGRHATGTSFGGAQAPPTAPATPSPTQPPTATPSGTPTATVAPSTATPASTPPTTTPGVTPAASTPPLVTPRGHTP